MTSPTPAEEAAARRKELAEAFADGFELFRSREEDRIAKADQDNKGATDVNASKDAKRRSISDWLLGN